jgi:hypothetical protein
LSALAPKTVDVSATTVTLHVPAASARNVNDEPDGCDPGGEAEQIVPAVSWTMTGTVPGVPAGTLPGFVSVACAVTDVDPPTLIDDDPSDAVTW